MRDEGVNGCEGRNMGGKKNCRKMKRKPCEMNMYVKEGG